MEDYILVGQAIIQVIRNFFYVIPSAIIMGIVVNKLSKEAR